MLHIVYHLYRQIASRIRKLTEEPEKYPMIYSDLILTDELHVHLQDVQNRSTTKLEMLMKELPHRNLVPDKTQDSLAWVQHMNSLKVQAEEIVLKLAGLVGKRGIYNQKGQKES